ncbi:YopX family protein [Leuconostoc falkenbergense]|uniref:YopX family protein n=1 Tax=Leuconostoc TaxID=1243 RepID=UPI0002DFD37D|nr:MULTISPECIES: YopX family protein [Leuconostoc]KDA48764.1 hypothetical protein L964_1983 [Leuconostoc pseudomesenteroides 1159]KDA50496.1 hypothetical protein L965_1886 [Leuconostoc pseudomesenteroides PS12]OQJ69474.1 hypothetical protein BMS79_08960 [Leuconostoc pseudomesenteroides]MDG9745595.1 YopX family protein [Leuconostoc falkenbergense]OQJ74034.1 hypothetical protein BMS80_05705 [Leuconostoc pseudomesenteroides]
MREIKFRAWDTSTERYYYNVQATHDADIGDSFQNILDNDELIVEQYTGMTDADGVEICEGDILKDFDENGIVGFVEYDEAYGEYSCGDDSLYEATRCCVVIGNIHKHADLLVDDINRMIPDDIGNDIHEFLHGGDK